MTATPRTSGARQRRVLAELRNPDASDYPTLALQRGRPLARHGREEGTRRWSTRGLEARARVRASRPSLSSPRAGRSSGSARPGADRRCGRSAGDWGVRHLARGRRECRPHRLVAERRAGCRREPRPARTGFEAPGVGLDAQPGQLPPREIRSVEFDATSKLVLAAGANGLSSWGRRFGTRSRCSKARRTWSRRRTSTRTRGASWPSFDGTRASGTRRRRTSRWSSPPVSEECGRHHEPGAGPTLRPVGCEGHSTRVWDTSRDLLLAELPACLHRRGGSLCAPGRSRSRGTRRHRAARRRRGVRAARRHAASHGQPRGEGDPRSPSRASDGTW